MSSHERAARAKIQLMERRQLEREALFSQLPRRGDVIDIVGDGKFRSVKKVLAEGSGRFVLTGDRVTVKYKGWLGTEMTDDAVSAAQRSAPFDANGDFCFGLGNMNVIQGWDMGVATMRVGERSLFLLAPEHAYGPRGAPPTIPPNATLLFEIELKDAKEPVALQGPSTPQILGGLVALAICVYYICFYTPGVDDTPDL